MLLLLLGLLLLLLPVLLLLLLAAGVGVATLHRLLVPTTISSVGSTSPKSPAPGTTLVAVVLCLLVVSLVRVIPLETILLISPVLLLLLLLLSLATLVAGPALLLDAFGALVDLLYYEGLIAPFPQVGGGSEDLNVCLPHRLAGCCSAGVATATAVAGHRQASSCRPAAPCGVSGRWWHHPDGRHSGGVSDGEPGSR